MTKMVRTDRSGAYAVLLVAVVAFVALVAIYVQGVSGNPRLVGKAAAIDGRYLIAKAPMVSMSCDDLDAHLKASAIYLPSETVGVNASNGVAGAFDDHCVDGWTLIENYCTDNGKVMQRMVSCQNGCRTGACDFYLS